MHDELHEEKIYLSLSGDMKITFMGVIDKLKYKDLGDKTIVAIIDYKTGNPNLDLTTIKYGIGMQLPIYLYLASNSKKIKNIEVGGFYLQKILNNEVTCDDEHSYEEVKKKNLLLQGYSSDNQDILSELDSSFNDSKMIRSMKTKVDGSFSHYAKVLSKEQMDKLTKIAKDKISEGAKKIIDAEYEISPKKIGNINYGCSLCKYSDICFRTNADIEELQTLSIDDIFKG